MKIEDFKKVEMISAKIINAEKIEKSEKLLKLELDDGSDKTRIIVSGIAKHYDALSVINKTVVIVSNLEPIKLMGIESHGMILMAEDHTDGSLYFVETVAEPGSVVT